MADSTYELTYKVGDKMFERQWRFGSDPLAISRAPLRISEVHKTSHKWLLIRQRHGSHVRTVWEE